MVIFSVLYTISIPFFPTDRDWVIIYTHTLDEKKCKCVPFAGLAREVHHFGRNSIVQFHAIGFCEHDPLIYLILQKTYIHSTHPHKDLMEMNWTTRMCVVSVCTGRRPQYLPRELLLSLFLVPAGSREPPAWSKNATGQAGCRHSVHTPVRASSRHTWPSPTKTKEDCTVHERSFVMNAVLSVCATTLLLFQVLTTMFARHAANKQTTTTKKTKQNCTTFEPYNARRVWGSVSPSRHSTPVRIALGSTSAPMVPHPRP